MKNIFRKLKQLFYKTNVIGSVAKSDFGKCTKCKFNYNGDGSERRAFLLHTTVEDIKSF